MTQLIKPLAPQIDWRNQLTKGLVFDSVLSERGGQAPLEGVSKTVGSFAGSPLPAWVPGRYGTALNFPATSNGGPAVYYTATPAQRTLTAFSVEILSYVRGLGANSAGCFVRTTDNTNSAWSISMDSANSNSFRFLPRFSGTVGIFDVTSFTLATFNHFVVQYNGASTSNLPTVWVNGIPRSVATTLTPVGTFDTTSDSQIVIGNINAGANVGNRTFDGHIFYVRIRNRGLTTAQVKSLALNPWQIYQQPPGLPYQALNTVDTSGWSSGLMMLGVGA